MKFPDFENSHLRILRWGTASYLLIYHLSFLSEALHLWGANGYVDRNFLETYRLSILLISNSYLLPFSLLTLLLFFSLRLLITNQTKTWERIALFILHASFLNANPSIVHEPHQIAQLMLLILCLHGKGAADRRMGQSWALFLLIYYFLAGVKKAPDSAWLEGQALKSLLEWPGLGLDNPFNKFLLTLPSFLLVILNYSVLLLELSAPAVFISKNFRNIWIPAALLMHLGILLSMDVGYFSWVMPVALLSIWDHPTLLKAMAAKAKI